MENLPFGHLTHLLLFRESEESYQTLLQTARRIIAEHHRPSAIITFLAEDLWLRDRRTCMFGSSKPSSSTSKTADPARTPDLNEVPRLPWPEDQYETQTIQLIRSFLSYAVTRGDMYRTPLVGSQHQVSGFAFTTTRRTKEL